MAYIDQEYLERRFGPKVLSGTVSANGTPAEMTGSVVVDYVNASSSWVDSYLDSYIDTPLSDPPEIILALTADRCYADLLIRAQIEVPEILAERIRDGVGYLGQLKENAIKVGDNQDPEKGSGGHVFSIVSGSTHFQPKDLRGIYV